jgi:DNA-directed RNA polymerase specialized sigma24 family protein
MSMDYDFYDNKGDEWSVAALLSDDQELRNAVAEYLMAKHNPDLIRYLRKRLPKSWAELAISEVWAGFYRTIQSQGVRESIGQLLGGIAKYKWVDMMKLRERERQLEADIPYELASMTTVEDMVELDELTEYKIGVPYGNSVLTPCQRVIWALERQYEFPREIISRILGKSRGTLDTHMSQANHKVKAEIEAERDRPMYWHDNPFAAERRSMSDAAVIVENFGSWLIPQLTPEEIEPLGLRQVELAQNYHALLIVPRWKRAASDTEYGQLSLLLVRREAKDQWKKEVGRIERNPEAKRFRFPEACMVDLDVDNGSINLSVQMLVEIWPDIDSTEYSGHTYLSTHHSPLLVPITLGEWHPSMYLDPEHNQEVTVYERWPFVPHDETWQ